ncbi:MAG: hypothetical protein D4R64_03575 [Porphyromonadaceae bacterium]|nr:MAG: hypothetical protein D4R64_03530 [Porphyromonadaceae bacterium]TSA38282.1 MAG: hypothetical protein D4R64_03575 [Porphyromonadaceae bacterium]
MENLNTPEINGLQEEDSGAIMTKRYRERKTSAKSDMPNILIEYTRERLMDDGTKQVVLLVYFAKQRSRFQTGVVIAPIDWDEDKGIVRKSHKEAAKLNLMVKNKMAKLTELFVRYTLQNTPLTHDRLREDYEKPEYVFDFIDFMERAIEERKGVVTESTIRQHTGILSKLKVYSPRLLSNKMTEEFFEGYSRYLKVTLKNEMNTRHGNFKTIRSYIQIAIRKGLLKESPMAKNPVKQLGGKRIFLSDVELRQMIELYRAGTLSDSRQNVLRWFLFSCFTGLRLSDLKRITFDDIAGDLLILIPYKSRNNSAKTVKIPLNDMAKQMIQDEGEFHVDNIIFNCISDQKMRKYIKLIVGELDINKVICKSCEYRRN